MGKIKIVVSDQQPFMIDGIIGFLGHYPDLYEVVGGYKDLKKAIAECNKSAAQIFILGEFAGGMMGSELVKWVKSHKIDAHIITFVAKMPYIDSIKLLEAGAKGCVWKTSHPAKLNRLLIRLVMATLILIVYIWIVKKYLPGILLIINLQIVSQKYYNS